MQKEEPVSLEQILERMNEPQSSPSDVNPDEELDIKKETENLAQRDREARERKLDGLLQAVLDKVDQFDELPKPEKIQLMQLLLEADSLEKSVKDENKFNSLVILHLVLVLIASTEFLLLTVNSELTSSVKIIPILAVACTVILADVHINVPISEKINEHTKNVHALLTQYSDIDFVPDITEIQSLSKKVARNSHRLIRKIKKAKEMIDEQRSEAEQDQREHTISVENEANLQARLENLTEESNTLADALTVLPDIEDQLKNDEN